MRWALYYFIVLDDMINSEGAYNALVRLGEDNLFSQYYKILYLLYNGDLKNIESEFSNFKSNYPSSMKGYILNALVLF